MSGAVVRLTAGVKLRGPEGAQRPRATSASTSELGGVCLGTTSSHGKAASHDLPDGMMIDTPHCESKVRLRNARRSTGTCHMEGPRATALLARLCAPRRRNHSRARQSPSRPRQLRIDLIAQQRGADRASSGRLDTADLPRTGAVSSVGKTCSSSKTTVHRPRQVGTPARQRRSDSRPWLATTASHDLHRSPYSAGGCDTIVLLRSRPRRNHASSAPRPIRAR